MSNNRARKILATYLYLKCLFFLRNKELNPDTTSISYVNRKFVSHLSTMQLNDCIAKIENETQCSIVVHGQNSELIWFCIKHDSDQQRRVAFNLINNVINFSLNVVNSNFIDCFFYCFLIN